MTKEQETTYNDKFKLFREYYACPDCHGAVTATIRYSDLTNQNSALREGDFLLAENSYRRYKNIMQLLTKMHEDGLIDTNYKVEIFYVGKFFTVNGTMLTGSEPAEYIKLVRQYGLSSKNTKNEETWSILLNHDRPYPPGTLGDQAEIEKIKKVALQEISDELFNKGIVDYMMVDAVKDGYLKDGERYHITYKDGVVTIKGKTLRINDQITYNNKLEQYIQKFESKSWYGSTRSTVKMSDILDPESGLRTKSRNNEDPSVNKNYMYDLMIAMHEEGLLDTAYQVRIRYNSLDNRLFVNEVKLEGPTADKYRSIIRKNEPDISKGKKISLAYQKNIEKSFPPTDSRKGYSKKSLQRISEDLYKTGYQGYIIADAVHDGYIEDGEYYKVNYKKDGFFIEGVILPIEVKKRYDDKMEAFIAMHKDVKRISWSISDTFEARKGIREFRYRITNGEGEAKEQTNKKTFKTSSVSIASGPFRIHNSKGSESQMKGLVRSMHRDNLLDSNSYHIIDYRIDDIYVNARKLTGSYADKYSAMLQAMGDKPGSGIIIEYVPKGVKVPDFYAGNTKIELQASGAYLPGIAELMFVDGNPNFILAHALHDGVLRERQNYTFQFSDGKTYFNGKLLPAAHQAKYTRLMRDFMAAHNVSSDKYIMRGDGVTKKLLNTPESAIRKERINKGRNEKGEYYVDRVIKMMAADGLIDTTQKHTMEYNARGVIVNGKKLSNEEAAKYEPILKAGYGRSPRWTAGDGISYSNEP